MLRTAARAAIAARYCGRFGHRPARGTMRAFECWGGKAPTEVCRDVRRGTVALGNRRGSPLGLGRPGMGSPGPGGVAWHRSRERVAGGAGGPGVLAVQEVGGRGRLNCVKSEQ